MFVQVPTYKIKLKDFNRYIQSEYGRAFNFLHDQNLAPGEEYVFEDIRGFLNTQEQKDIDDFIKGYNVDFVAHSLLKHLVSTEKLSPGTYIIDCS